MRDFLKSVFSGCRHSWGWPRSTRNGHKCLTYQACVNCGSERNYDARRMRPLNG